MTTPAPLLLAAGECHLHVTRVDDPAVLARLAEYEAWLTPEEQARRARYHFARHRHEYLVTRALARATLGRYGGVAPGSLVFENGQWGKPAIVAPDAARGLSFNLSNTAGMVTCLVARDRELGVDVERIDRGGDLIGIADRFFSADEVRALHALPEARHLERFFIYWTLKEAYIKARGMGLALPLGGFTFHVEDEARPTISFAESVPDDPTSWRFATMRIGPSHRVSYALRCEPGEAPTVQLIETSP